MGSRKDQTEEQGEVQMKSSLPDHRDSRGERRGMVDLAARGRTAGRQHRVTSRNAQPTSRCWEDTKGGTRRVPGAYPASSFRQEDEETIETAKPAAGTAGFGGYRSLNLDLRQRPS